MNGRQKTAEEISTDAATNAATNAAHNRQLLLFKSEHHVREQKIYHDVARGMLCLFSETCLQAAIETRFQRLLHAAVGAEPESYQQKYETNLAAIAILKRHPGLLFVKGMVTDNFGRKIFASPYQLLHGARDVWALKQVHEEIIPHIDGGETKAQSQFQEQFPNCELPFNPELGEAALYDDRNIAQIAQVKENLKSIVAVISADPCINGVARHPETTAVVAELRELFAPKNDEVIRTGLHFPIAIMKEISRVYDVQFALWSANQRSFFSREVIRAALDASTAVDGQCYKHGLSKLNPKKGPDRRDGLFCRHPKGIPPELSAPLMGKLGRALFVDPYNGYSCFESPLPKYFYWYTKNGRGWHSDCEGLWEGGGMVSYSRIFGKHIATKNVIFGEIMLSRREEKTFRCVIC